MEWKWVFGSAFMVLCSSRMNESSVEKQVNVAYLSKGIDWKTCLNMDCGSVSPAKTPMDLGGFINISDMKTAGQNCDKFHLSQIVDDLLNVIPETISSKCFHFTNCSAYVIM